MFHLLSGFLLLIGHSFAQDQLSADAVSFTEPQKITIFDDASVDFPLYTYTAQSQTASSTLKGYPVAHLVDGKNNTAWVEGEKGSGVNSTITFTFPMGEHQPDVIKIVPGYLKSDKLWYANQRVSKVRLRFLKSDEENKAVIEDTIVTLKKIDGRIPPKAQYIMLNPLFLHNMGFMDFQYLEVTILEVDDQGSKFSDTCISEISFYKHKISP